MEFWSYFNQYEFSSKESLSRMLNSAFRWSSVFVCLLVWNTGLTDKSFGACQADVTLAPIFSDHMVLQQQSTTRIWGKAAPGEEIVVTFNEQVVNGTANADGNWSIPIQTPKAGGPHKLEVSRKAGEPKIVLTDVMVGEVWICSGQSNMEWPVTAAANPEKEIDAAKEFPQVRLFTIHHNLMLQPQTDFGRCNQWGGCSPESIKSFSATAYFFGRALNRQLNVPIGLINTSWGGTPCESWTSEECLKAGGSFGGLFERWTANQDPNNPHRPGVLYNGMIAPLAGFAFRGAIWYQGESNVGRGEEYARMFPTMIKCWRNNLAGGQAFPFLFVQIAPFRYGGQDPEAMPEVWDAQFKSLRSVEATGMVVTTDIGNVADIHPANKQDVGNRLSLWALHLAYRGMMPEGTTAPVFSGPLYREQVVEGKKIRLRFDHAEGGLKTRDGQAPSFFTICGADEKFVPAQAEIDGDSLLVWAEGVEAPVAVRFAWLDTAEPNLVNQAGLPASPFRTDNFTLKSAGK
jgi:sialate O-acetylesterase